MRIAAKATKGRGRRVWPRGQACSSNPATKTFRAKAKLLWNGSAAEPSSSSTRTSFPLIHITSEGDVIESATTSSSNHLRKGRRLKAKARRSSSSAAAGDRDHFDEQPVEGKRERKVQLQTPSRNKGEKRKRDTDVEQQEEEEAEAEDDEEMNKEPGWQSRNDAGKGYRTGGKGIHRPLNRSTNDDAAAAFRSKKGRSDEKRKGVAVDPYAYVPLNRAVLNKRRRLSMKGQFKQLVGRKGKAN